MRILIIGGTHFVGHGMAQAALDAGHDVTLLHRNRTDELPGATHLLADRERRPVGAGRRRVGRHDRRLRLPPRPGTPPARGARGPRRPPPLRLDRLGLPRSPPAPAPSEDSPLFDEPADDVEEVTNETYGPLKVACERVAREAYGDAGLALIRPTYVVGPRDATARYPWWVLRAARGGTMLAARPGRGADAVRRRARHGRVDGAAGRGPRDRGLHGGPPVRRRSRRWSRRRSPRSAATPSLVQVDGDWLVEQGVDGTQLPLWSEGSPELALAMGTARAEAAGLTHRPFAGRRPRHPRLGARPIPTRPRTRGSACSPSASRSSSPRGPPPRHEPCLAHRLDGHPADDLHHDVRPRDPHRRGQPRPGLPRRRRPGVRARRPRARPSPSGANQYAPGNGVAALRQAIARHQQRHYGLELDPDTPGGGDHGLHRGDRGRPARPGRPGRRGRRARALLRLLRRDDPDGRRRTASGHPARTRLPARRRRAPRGRRPAHPLRAAQLAPQPDRHRAHARGAPGGRRRGDRARPRRDHRRGVRAPHLRRPRARAARHAAGDVRADPDPVERRQELQRHRLEGRLGDRPRRARGRGPGGQRSG